MKVAVTFLCLIGFFTYLQVNAAKQLEGFWLETGSESESALLIKENYGYGFSLKHQVLFLFAWDYDEQNRILKVQYSVRPEFQANDRVFRFIPEKAKLLLISPTLENGLEEYTKVDETEQWCQDILQIIEKS